MKASILPIKIELKARSAQASVKNGWQVQNLVSRWKSTTRSKKTGAFDDNWKNLNLEADLEGLGAVVFEDESGEELVVGELPFRVFRRRGENERDLNKRGFYVEARNNFVSLVELPRSNKLLTPVIPKVTA